MATLSTVAEAIARLDALPLPTPGTETVPLADAAGRTLAADVWTDRDYPPFDKSQMDGFAVRGGGPWRVVGTTHAGEPAATLGDGEAAGVMTGAPLPAGAEAVVPVEATRVEGDTLHADTPPAGRAVARAGSDRPADLVVIERGVTLRPAHLAVLAQVGRTDVPVCVRPVVGLLTTGDEVVPPDRTPGPSQIRDATTAPLTALLHHLGCAVEPLGHAADDAADLRSRLDRPDLPAVVVAGGMSMGTRDHVPSVLADLGARPVVSKLAMKPGKPFACSQSDTTTFLGLPGNPVSGYVTLLRLGSRVLGKLAGRRVGNPLRPATLATDLPDANGPREFYQPCRLTPAGVLPLHWRGSGDVFTLADADALIVRPPNDPPHPAGGPVSVLPLP